MQLSNREIAAGLINSIAESKLPLVINILKKVQNDDYPETEPDEWDMELLSEAEEENNGTFISLEDLAKDLGIAL